MYTVAIIKLTLAYAAQVTIHIHCTPPLIRPPAAVRPGRWLDLDPDLDPNLEPAAHDYSSSPPSSASEASACFLSQATAALSLHPPETTPRRGTQQPAGYQGLHASVHRGQGSFRQGAAASGHQQDASCPIPCTRLLMGLGPMPNTATAARASQSVCVGALLQVHGLPATIPSRLGVGGEGGRGEGAGAWEQFRAEGGTEGGVEGGGVLRNNSLGGEQQGQAAGRAVYAGTAGMPAVHAEPLPGPAMWWQCSKCIKGLVIRRDDEANT